MSRIRTYSELCEIGTLIGRYEFLKVHSEVGIATFGGERWLNQAFYTSREWKHARDVVIARDLGCDLGIEGFDIHDKVFVHHMNPITIEQVARHDQSILDPETLITVSFSTHNAIHYGSVSLLPQPVIVRRPGDTKLW